MAWQVNILVGWDSAWLVLIDETHVQNGKKSAVHGDSVPVRIAPFCFCLSILWYCGGILCVFGKSF